MVTKTDSVRTLHKTFGVRNKASLKNEPMSIIGDHLIADSSQAELNDYEINYSYARLNQLKSSENFEQD